MTSNPPTVSDDIVLRLRDQLGNARLVELTALVAVENLRSRFNSALVWRARASRPNAPCRRGKAVHGSSADPLEEPA